MTDLERVGLHTVPSTWVSPFSDSLDEPYRRVVGLSRASDTRTTTWLKVDPCFPESDYDRTDAAFEVIEMPSLTAERLLSFFNRYFGDERRAKPVLDGNGHQIDVITEGYNCHRFGYWMKGTPAAQQFEVPGAPDFITKRPAFSGNLPIGRHCVLGTVGAAVHSVVGLGEDRDECLQVLASQGHMGIDTYERVVDQYDYMRTRDMQFFV